MVVSRQITSSPQRGQKPEMHDKQRSHSRPPVDTKFGRIGKQNTRGSPRRFDRVEKSFLSSKQSGGSLCMSDMKWKEKKHKSVAQLIREPSKAQTDPDSIPARAVKMNARHYKAIFKRKRRMDTSPDRLNFHLQIPSSSSKEVRSGKAESGLESTGVKRKKMDAHCNQAVHRKQQKMNTLSDVDKEFEGSDVLSPVVSGDGRATGSEPKGKKGHTGDERSGRMVEKMRVKPVDEASLGAPKRLIFSLTGSSLEIIDNDINAESIPGHSNKDLLVELPHGDGIGKSGVGYRERETIANAGTGRVSRNCSSANNDIPESVSLTSIGRSCDCAMDAVNFDQHNCRDGMRSTRDTDLDHTTVDAGKDDSPESTTDSSSKCLLAAADISKEPTNVDKEVLQFSYSELNTVKSGVQDKSTTVEPRNYDIISQQQEAPKIKISRSEIEDKTKKIQEKHVKKIGRIVRKQRKEIQKFHKIWEEKKLEVENNYKLEKAFVQFVYGQGYMSINKLKILDEDIAEKLEEHKLQKDMNLKALEAEQSAALKDGKEKVSYLLAEAKHSCHEIRSVDEPCVPESQSEDPVCSQAYAQIAIRSPETVISRSEQHIEDRFHKEIMHDLHENDVVPSNTSLTKSAEAVGCIASTATDSNLLNIISEREVRIVQPRKTSAVTTQRPKELNSHAFRVEISDEASLSDHCKEVSVEVPEYLDTDIVGHSCSVEGHNVPKRECDEVHLTDSPRNVKNESDGADKLINGDPLLLPLEQTVASPGHSRSLPQNQVAEDESYQCSVSAAMQDRDAQGTKGLKATTLVEAASSESIEAVTCVQSEHEVTQNREHPPSEMENQTQHEARSPSRITVASPHLTEELERLSNQANYQTGENLELHRPVASDYSTLMITNTEATEAETPAQSNHEAVENCEQLQQVLAHVSSGYAQALAIEVEHQTQDEGRHSSQTAEVLLHLSELEAPSCQFNCQGGGRRLEIHPTVAQVAEDESYQCSVSAAMQDRDAQGTNNLKATALVEASSSESNEAVTCVQSEHEIIQNREPPPSEMENQTQHEARGPSRITVASPRLTEELETRPNQANYQTGENLELHHPVTSDYSTLSIANTEAMEAESPVQSSDEVLEYCEQLQQVSAHVSSGCAQASAIEVEHRTQGEGRHSSQTAEVSLHLSELQAPSCQFTCQGGGRSLEMHPPVTHAFATLGSSHRELGSANRVDTEPRGEFYSSSGINVTIPLAVTSTVELPNQAVLQSGEDVSHLQGPSNFLGSPSNPMGFMDTTQSVCAKPLYNEQLRLQKELEEAEKAHKDQKLQLKCDCEKEIQKIISQIRANYDKRLQDAEVAHQLKKNELNNKYNKVLLHKTVADAFIYILGPSGNQGMRQALQCFHMQHQNQLQLPTPVSPPPGFSACPPVSGPDTIAPDAQNVQLSVSHSMRPSHVAAFTSSPPVRPLLRTAAQSEHLHTMVAPSIPHLQHSTALFRGVAPQPPHISTLTPSTGNHSVSREIHFRARHLQASRPAASSLVASVASFQPRGLSQQGPVFQPPASPPFYQYPTQEVSPSQYQQLPHSHPWTPQAIPTGFISHGPLALTSISQSARGSYMNVDNQARVQVPRSFSPVPRASLTADLAGQPQFQSLGNILPNPTSSAVRTDVVYLSDDD